MAVFLLGRQFKVMHKARACLKGTSGTTWHDSTVVHHHGPLSSCLKAYAHSSAACSACSRAALALQTFLQPCFALAVVTRPGCCLSRLGTSESPLQTGLLPCFTLAAVARQVAACPAHTAGSSFSVDLCCCPASCRCPCSCKKASRLRMGASFCMLLTVASTRRRWGRV